MLSDRDVGALFATLHASYGHLWPHKADAIPVWQHKLSAFSRDEVMAAADRALAEFERPPSIAQFLDICRASRPRRQSTYLPPPEYPVARCHGNRILSVVLNANRGVDNQTLRLLVDLKNALIEDLGDNPPTEAWLEDLETQLRALARDHDPDKKAAEKARAESVRDRRRDR